MYILALERGLFSYEKYLKIHDLKRLRRLFISLQKQSLNGRWETEKVMG